MQKNELRVNFYTRVLNTKRPTRTDIQTTVNGSAGSVNNTSMQVTLPNGHAIIGITLVCDNGNVIPHVQDYNATSGEIIIACYYIFDVTSAKVSANVISQSLE